MSKLVNLENLIITSFIQTGAVVLDLGCGNGELLFLLEKQKQCKVRGIEIDEQAIYRCVARGLSVVHGDIDSSLQDYPDGSFDYIVLNQSFQQVKKPDNVLKESLRIAKWVVVSFPNFASLTARSQIFFKGRTPVTPSLPYEWYNTPNLHFLSISDFFEYCRKRNIHIVKTAFAANGNRIKIMPNLFATTGIFVLANKKNGDK